jgi:AcrR family transcriptional regulator
MNVKRPRRLSRSETKAQTRAKLLEAGARVLAGEGYYGATVEDIAETAGFTRGAFYAHFADKADLLLTLLEEQGRAGLDDLEARLDGRADQLDATMAWFQERFMMASGLDRAVAEFGVAGCDNPEYQARLRRLLDDARIRVGDMSVEGFARAGMELPMEPERFATMVIAVVNGLASMQRLDPAAVPPEMIGEAITYLGEGVLAAAQRVDA